MAGKQNGDTVSLVEQVYDATRRAILEGRYKPGQRLRLQDIAQENDVSFIPVREALRLLEAGRLVEIIPNKGARVSDVSEEDMVDAYRLRILLECKAVELAATGITKEELAEADQYYAEMIQAFAAGDVETSSATHRAFHLSLYHAARSPWLIHLIELLMSNTDRYRRLLTPARPTAKHLAEIRRQHRDILEAVREGNPAKAAEALRAHLQNTQERYSAGLAERV
ncbi:MAG TPA: GntR family transcriptional regulator [Devosia sp.]|nr:GntR family transcriptional regulator [Devosia sp.]